VAAVWIACCAGEVDVAAKAKVEKAKPEQKPAAIPLFNT